MTTKSTFQRGSGCYRCNCCKRQTRATGDNWNSGACPECYEIAGLENALSDNGPEWEFRESTKKEIERLQEVVRQKGGKF
jgi:hypothetical protein